VVLAIGLRVEGVRETTGQGDLAKGAAENWPDRQLS